MKIRIAGNSIRFRLKQPEVEYFSQHRSISEALDLGPAAGEQLRFTLKMTNGKEFSIKYSGQTVNVHIPQQVAEKWARTDLVGIEEKIDTSNATGVRLLVEKDFACLDRAGEENEGSYPNPKANC